MHAVVESLTAFIRTQEWGADWPEVEIAELFEFLAGGQKKISLDDFAAATVVSKQACIALTVSSY